MWMHTNDSEMNKIKLVNVLVNVPTQTGRTNAVGLVSEKVNKTRRTGAHDILH